MNQKKFIAIIDRYFDSPFIRVLKNGMMYTIPITIVGSIFLILQQIHFAPDIQNAMAHIVSFSFNIIGLVTCLGISYAVTRELNEEDPLLCMLSALITYFIICSDVNKNTITLPLEWIGSKGMMAAMIVGGSISTLYICIERKKIAKSFFKGLPKLVQNAFGALIPLGVILLFDFIIYFVNISTTNKPLVQVTYQLLQLPLQNLSDSFIGISIISLIISIFWLFGIHGNAVIGGIVTPLLMTNSIQNQSIINKFGRTSLTHGAHIVTHQFLNQFITMTGSGISIGLILVMITCARKEEFKKLGLLGLIPSLFNINEPIMFGIPIVLNPYLAIPFILVPLTSSALLYGSIYYGILPPFNGIILPWITPPIISGLLLGSYKYSIFQVIIVAISYFLYLPFYKKFEKHA